MAQVEVCSACGRQITGDLIPRRVLGEVFCPPCDRKRVENINRRDRGPVITFLAAAHAVAGLGLLLISASGILEWWRAPDEETSLIGFLTALLLLPLGAVFAWVAWNLWRLEGRGRLVALLLDIILAFLAAYWLIDGQRLALFGLVPLFAVIYLSRSKTADRFW
jgi:hypothetical protein